MSYTGSYPPPPPLQAWFAMKVLSFTQLDFLGHVVTMIINLYNVYKELIRLTPTDLNYHFRSLNFTEFPAYLQLS